MGTKQRLLGVGLALWGLLNYAWVVNAMHEGNWARAAVAAFFVFVVLLLMRGLELLRGADPRMAKDMVNPRVQSRVMLFGYTLALPFAVAMATLAWGAMEPPAFFISVWWNIIAGVFGVVVGYMFHQSEFVNYAKDDSLRALDSPTKWTHDGPTIWVLAGGLLNGGVPVVVQMFSDPDVRRYGYLMLVGVLGYVVLAVLDVSRAPRPHRIHPRYWDVRTFRVVRPGDSV